MSDAKTTMQALGAQARAAAKAMRTVSTGTKNKALTAAATVFRREMAEIIAANELDMKAAAEAGLDAAMQDRLRLDANRIEAMAEGLEQVARLPDPVGAIAQMAYRPSGIQVGHMRVPLGVIAPSPPACAEPWSTRVSPRMRCSSWTARIAPWSARCSRPRPISTSSSRAAGAR